ncbi:hypothetical protein C9J48_24055 [Photobacterium profundum]|uniref:Uncharacterized protein n=1 Tax=Photobacterium profundum 3TCK TaxID=314280 RepID=Q1Z9E1_9GAMM|nr:hypothetical protein [Photobacterium profundum]EAS44817.1 hypothetical protein P3TCK_20075 [Photobacterium profundum 3TCK]PSV59332.1 hypothetical protein C9J48_24055 [Photobacterium profundum]
MDNNGWPTRASINPTAGGQRCECGDVRTLHRSRGKRARFLYSMCDKCGTDQRTGDPVQRVFNQFYVTKAELITSEQAQPEESSIIEEASPTPTETSGESGDNKSPIVKPDKPATTCLAEQTRNRTTTDNQTEKEPQQKRIGWGAVLCGIVLGGLTGGAIVKFN